MDELRTGQIVRIRQDAWKDDDVEDADIMSEYRNQYGVITKPSGDAGYWLCEPDDIHLGVCEVAPKDVDVLAEGA